MTFITELAELMTAIIVGILFSIFISACFILVLILQKKSRNGTSDFWNKTEFDCQENHHKNMSEIKLLKPFIPEMMKETSEMSFSDESYDNFYNINPVIPDDPLWAEQVSTLISHSMAVLVHCRTLTERLTNLAINTLDEWDPQMEQLVDLAKVITVRVDQFINCMRPPLNPTVLEARAASLTLAVTHLAILTQFECQNNKLPAEWVSKLLSNIQKHINMLNYENGNDFTSKQSIHKK